MHTLSLHDALPISGTGGLQQENMQDAPVEADLVFWMRPGGHSITQRDWDFWLDWLDNVMARGDEVPTPTNRVKVAPAK